MERLKYALEFLIVHVPMTELVKRKRDARSSRGLSHSIVKTELGESSNHRFAQSKQCFPSRRLLKLQKTYGIRSDKKCMERDY